MVLVTILDSLDSPAWTESGTGLIVPFAAGRSRRYSRPVGVDLFCGAGGFSIGFHQAGFHVAAAMDVDPDAATTYMLNLARPGVRIHFDTPEREAAYARRLERGMGLAGKRAKQPGLVVSGLAAGSGWIAGYGKPYDPTAHPNDYLAEINRPPVHPDGCEHFWLADIRKVPGQDILDALELRAGEVDVVFGSPPCQGFSMANAKRSPMDPRNSFVFDFCRVVLELRPKAMALENVPQLATMVTPEGVPVIDAMARVLADGSFAAYDALRNALRDRPDVRMALRSDSRHEDDSPQPVAAAPADDLGVQGDLLEELAAAR